MSVEKIGNSMTGEQEGRIDLLSKLEELGRIKSLEKIGNIKTKEQKGKKYLMSL